MKEITIELNTSVNYSSGGNDLEANFITVSPPTGKIAGIVGFLKVEIGKATKKSLEGIDLSSVIKDDQESENKEDEDPMSTGDAVFQMLLMGGADIGLIIEKFKSILKFTAKIGGEKDFNDGAFNRMDYNDVEKCLKLYIGNFIKA